jgi:hypothetical protein
MAKNVFKLDVASRISEEIYCKERKLLGKRLCSQA